jgi:hypothetical protein
MVSEHIGLHPFILNSTLDEGAATLLRDKKPPVVVTYEPVWAQ